MYLRRTRSWYTRSKTTADADRDQLHVYADASFADQADYKSQSGFLVFLNGMLIDSSSVTQKAVALSTMEAEVNAVTHAARASMYLRYGLAELGITQRPTMLHEDNEAAITYLLGRQVTARNRHMGTKTHYIRERPDVDFHIRHCLTAEQLADLCTKTLPAPQHNLLCQKIFTDPDTTTPE